MEILEYAFMRRAFLTGILLAIIIPCIGIVIVLKRLSMIGDALSHTSLAGVAAGLVIGINPVIGAVISCIAASIGIEVIRKKIPRYSEMSIAIIMSAGIGLAGVLSSFVKNNANFNSFLFGSIVSVSNFEMFLVIGISIVVILSFIVLFKEFFYISLDERSARLAGVPVKQINFIFTVFTAVTISIAARTVGALIVSSLMVVPVACALQFEKNYKRTVIYSIIFAVIFMILGLTISYYVNLRPGATVVLVGVITLVLILIGKKMFSAIRRVKIN